MLTLPGSVKVFLCLVPVDMRLSFDRLAARRLISTAKTRCRGICMSFRPGAATG
jgi:hypothetical protein